MKVCKTVVSKSTCNCRALHNPSLKCVDFIVTKTSCYEKPERPEVYEIFIGENLINRLRCFPPRNCVTAALAHFRHSPRRTTVTSDYCFYPGLFLENNLLPLYSHAEIHDHRRENGPRIARTCSVLSRGHVFPPRVRPHTREFLSTCALLSAVNYNTAI